MVYVKSLFSNTPQLNNNGAPEAQCLACAGHGDGLYGEGRWRMEVDSKRSASEFDAGYCGKLLEKTWKAVAFVS